MGTMPLKPAFYLIQLRVIIPTDRTATRMDTGLLPWIVIPVVVGSSPISHPIRTPINSAQVAIKSVAHWFPIQRIFP